MTRPLMSDSMRNPYPVFSVRWMSWKEQYGTNAWGGRYAPYHVGTTPSGENCPTMPRAVLVRPDTYRCPACGKEWPTATARLAAMEAAGEPVPPVLPDRTHDPVDTAYREAEEWGQPPSPPAATDEPESGSQS